MCKRVNRLGRRFAKACVRWEKTKRLMAPMDPSYIAKLERKLSEGKLYNVSGSYGHLILNRKGRIVGWQDYNGGWCPECPKEYAMIRLFDMKCYLSYSKSNLIDISELSEWGLDGRFVPYSPETRYHVKRGDSRIL